MMSKKSEFLCCCSSLTPSRETARFYLLGIFIAVYMLVGAGIFSTLERPAELMAHRLWDQRLKDFSQMYNITCEELESLLLHYEEARTAGIRAEPGRALWDIPGAFYFVGTVVSTIGFGVSAPSTLAGKVLLVFYGLFGCSATILFFNFFLERFITLLSFLTVWFHKRKSRKNVSSEINVEENNVRERKPSVYQVTFILLCAVLLVACGAALLYSAMEGWTFLESLYFCFVAFSTVGFGDFVSSQRQHHEEIWPYKIANCLLMLLGVCCTYSLFNATSVIMKQGLDWTLGTLGRIFNSIKHHRLEARPFFKRCSLESESSIFSCEDNNVSRQQLRAMSGSGHSMLWRPCVPSAIGKCLCDKAKVETVCHRIIEPEDSSDVKQENISHLPSAKLISGRLG